MPKNMFEVRFACQHVGFPKADNHPPQKKPVGNAVWVGIKAEIRGVVRLL